MAAFLLRHHRQRQILIVHRSRRRLPSASLGALRPSSAGFMSVQTSSASETHARTFFGLQRQARGLQRCAPSKRLFFGASKSARDCQRVTTSNIKRRVSNCGELRGRGNGLRRRRGNETRKRRDGGVCETDPPREDRYPFVLKSTQQARVIKARWGIIFRLSLGDRGKRMSNYSTRPRIYM